MRSRIPQIPQRKMAALRDAYLLDVDKSSRPLQRFQEGARLLKAAEEIVAVAQGLQKEFWDFWVMSHEARYLEIMRGLQESGDASRRGDLPSKPMAQSVGSPSRWGGW